MFAVAALILLAVLLPTVMPAFSGHCIRHILECRSNKFPKYFLSPNLA